MKTSLPTELIRVIIFIYSETSQQHDNLGVRIIPEKRKQLQQHITTSADIHKHHHQKTLKHCSKTTSDIKKTCLYFFVLDNYTSIPILLKIAYKLSEYHFQTVQKENQS